MLPDLRDISHSLNVHRANSLIHASRDAALPIGDTQTLRALLFWCVFLREKLLRKPGNSEDRRLNAVV